MKILRDYTALQEITIGNEAGSKAGRALCCSNIFNTE